VTLRAMDDAAAGPVAADATHRVLNAELRLASGGALQGRSEWKAGGSGDGRTRPRCGSDAVGPRFYHVSASAPPLS
jgi:hypothetical protein